MDDSCFLVSSIGDFESMELILCEVVVIVVFWVEERLFFYLFVYTSLISVVLTQLLNFIIKFITFQL